MFIAVGKTTTIKDTKVSGFYYITLVIKTVLIYNTRKKYNFVKLNFAWKHLMSMNSALHLSKCNADRILVANIH